MARLTEELRKTLVLKIDYIEFHSPEQMRRRGFFADACGRDFIADVPDYRGIRGAGLCGGIERHGNKARLIVLLPSSCAAMCRKNRPELRPGDRPLFLPAVCLLIQKASQLARPGRMLELAQSLRLDLADAFARHAELLADLFERVVGIHADPEAHAQHALFPGRQG